MSRDRNALTELKRENRRLRKELHKFTNAQEDAEESAQTDETTEEPKTRKEKVAAPDGKRTRKPQKAESDGPGCPTCPKCNDAGTEIILLGQFRYYFCIERCGYRRKI